jgi:hypothetical protein
VKDLQRKQPQIEQEIPPILKHRSDKTSCMWVKKKVCIGPGSGTYGIGMSWNVLECVLFIDVFDI